MKNVLIYQMILTVVGGLLLAFFYAPQQALSFAVGSFIILTSFSFFGLGFGMIFQKKLIALAVLIIVFKYAILGIIIYTLVRLSWFDPLWFALGVASFMISALGYALKESLKKP